MIGKYKCLKDFSILQISASVGVRQKTAPHREIWSKDVTRYLKQTLLCKVYLCTYLPFSVCPFPDRSPDSQTSLHFILTFSFPPFPVVKSPPWAILGEKTKALNLCELLPVSHLIPVNPCWQTQLLGETQVPPFWHNPSHIARGRRWEKSYYSLRLTSINYLIRAAVAAYVFAYRIRANLVMWFIMSLSWNYLEWLMHLSKVNSEMFIIWE